MCTLRRNDMALSQQATACSDGAKLAEETNSHGDNAVDSHQQTSESLQGQDSLKNDFRLLERMWPAKDRNTFCKAMKVFMWQHLVLRGCARSELEMEFSAMVDHLWNQLGRDPARKRLREEQQSEEREETMTPKAEECPFGDIDGHEASLEVEEILAPSCTVCGWLASCCSCAASSECADITVTPPKRAKREDPSLACQAATQCGPSPA